MAVVITIDVEFGDRPVTDPKESFERVLRELDRKAAPATFFIQGRWAKAHPHLVAELAERGAPLGLHGHAHVDYRRLTSEGIRLELADGLAALEQAAPGVAVPYVRLPHGYGTDDPSIVELLGEANLEPVGWDFSTFDWDESLAFDRRSLRVAAALECGGVVLFHSWPKRTADLIHQLVESADDGAVVGLDSLVLPGRKSSGHTMHVAYTDPPR